MTWLMSANLRRELESGECRPVVAAHVALPALHWLTIVNYAVGAGDTVTVNYPTGSEAITEGVDFTASTSNAATAQAITNAWNSSIDRLTNTQAEAVWQGGDRVAFVGLNASIQNFTLATSDANAWAETLPAADTTARFCSWTGGLADSLLDHTPAISEMTGLEWSLDPVTRETTVPRVDLEFSGGLEVRELIDYYPLKRASVSLYLGTDTLNSFGDFMQLPTLFVEDVTRSGGRFTLKLVDGLGDQWRDQTVTGRWTGWHPLQIVLDIFTKANAVDGVHYAASSIQYDTADTNRSHFVVSRYDDQEYGARNGVDEGEKAGDLVTELIALMSGTLRPTQAGPYEFIPFDLNRSVARAWDANPQTGHDVDEIEQESLYENQISSCTVSFLKLEGVSERAGEYKETDYISFRRARDLLSDFQFRTDWINSRAVCQGNGLEFIPNDTFVAGSWRINDTTTEYPVVHASRQGFCGTMRVDGSPTTLAPGMSMGGTTGRYAVHRISSDRDDARSDGLNEVEDIAIDGWTLMNDLPDVDSVQAAPAGMIIMVANAYRAIVTNDSVSTALPNGLTLEQFLGVGTEAGLDTGRGLGVTTTPTAWNGLANASGTRVLYVDDITIPVYLSKEIVRRFRDGAPKTSHMTSLGHVDVEIGDFVTINDPDVVLPKRGTAGVDETVLWEVTSKKVDIFGDSPGVEWELTFVQDTSIGSVPYATAEPTPPVLVVTGSSTTPDDKSIITETFDDVVDEFGNSVETE